MPQDDTLTHTQFEQYLAKMAAQREALLELIRPLSNAMRNWKPNNDQMSIHELLMHIGSNECWYVSKLGKRVSMPSEVTMIHFLFRSRDMVLVRLHQLSDAQLNQEFDDGWQVTRVFDRILAHEQEHIDQIQDLLLQWRHDLTARLAAERAYLFNVLLGLSAAQLTTAEPMPDWTVKDLLAHIAFWDGFHTNRMQMVADGRIREIMEIGDDNEMDALNARLLAEQKAMPLEQAFAMLQKERGGFMQLLKRLSDMELQSQIRLPWGWRTHLRVWAKWRYQHDMEHAEQIQAWRETCRPKKSKATAPHSCFVLCLEPATKSLSPCCRLLPEAEWRSRPVCGVWTMKDLIGHLAAWAEVGVAGLDQVAAGETPTFEPIADFEEWNLAEAAKRTEWPWETVWQAYEDSYQALVSGLDTLSDGQLAFEFKRLGGLKPACSAG